MTRKWRYTDEDVEFLRPLGFVPAPNGVSFTNARPRRRYIQLRNSGWRACVEDSNRADRWLGPAFPDPITCYIHAEACQWQP